MTFDEFMKEGVLSPHDRYALSLPEAIQKLHESMIGTAERLPYDIEKPLVAWLKRRLEQWAPEHELSRRYEENMKALLTTVLQEHDSMSAK